MEWACADGTVSDWVAQFSFSFYRRMLTSALIGLIAMVLHRNSHAKAIGYRYDKGTAYIKKSSEQICRVFKRSPVFRIGGDEFAAVLRNVDY